MLDKQIFQKKSSNNIIRYVIYFFATIFLLVGGCSGVSIISEIISSGGTASIFEDFGPLVIIVGIIAMFYSVSFIMIGRQGKNMFIKSIITIISGILIFFAIAYTAPLIDDLMKSDLKKAIENYQIYDEDKESIEKVNVAINKGNLDIKELHEGLEYAVSQNKIELAKVLIKAGANVKFEGAMLIMLAKDNNSSDMVKILKDAGAIEDISEEKAADAVEGDSNEINGSSAEDSADYLPK